jgi:hypothetical protein
VGKTAKPGFSTSFMVFSVTVARVMLLYTTEWVTLPAAGVGGVVEKLGGWFSAGSDVTAAAGARASRQAGNPCGANCQTAQQRSPDKHHRATSTG